MRGSVLSPARRRSSVRRLLRLLSPQTGTRRRGGYLKHSASMPMRARGTMTPGTGTTAGCSSYSALGPVLVVQFGPTLPNPANNSFERGWFGSATVTPGGNGEPPERAGCDE